MWYLQLLTSFSALITVQAAVISPAPTATILGSVSILNACGDGETLLYQNRTGSSNTTYPQVLPAWETFNLPFSAARPEDPTANHTLSFDIWPSRNSDRKRKIARRQDIPGNQSQDKDFGFKFLIWDVEVGTESVSLRIRGDATDPFDDWGWGWKLGCGITDEKICTTLELECAFEGCSPAEKAYMIACPENLTR